MHSRIRKFAAFSIMWCCCFTSKASDDALPLVDEHAIVDHNVTTAQALAPIAPIQRDDQTSANNGENDRRDDRISALLKRRGEQDRSPTGDDRRVIGGADIVFGRDAISRAAADAGDLLRKSPSAVGISSQQRTPIVNDTRVRGERVGQVLAAGSYWFPARMDLDTMLNKIDSKLVDDLVVIKGPYSSRFGPAFNFIDIQLVQSPRFDGFESHGSTSVTHKFNGEQWFGRQSLQAGSDNWGAFVSYGHSLGNDYEDGSSDRIPASFKSRDVFAAFGWDPTPESRIEFTYLRLDQTDTEFPGLVFDIDALVTDGFELKYYDQNPLIGDELFAEGWYNRTRFHGDSQGVGKASRLPSLKTIFFSPDGNSGAAFTNARASSSGGRADTTFYVDERQTVTVGVDLLGLNQELNDLEANLSPLLNNFPIPPAYLVDIGMYLETERVVHDYLQLRTGGRIDYVKTGADNMVPGVPEPISTLHVANLPQDFFLWSLFVASELTLTEKLSSIANYGFAQRPPTLTELYAAGPFIGTLQHGLTFVGGDPLLRQERIHQIDFGLDYQGEFVKSRASVFNAWVSDLIAYDRTEPVDPRGGLTTGVLFTNTDLATFKGFDFQYEVDLTNHFDGYAVVSYVEGEDRSREKSARRRMGPRSNRPGIPEEYLPGIPPLESVIGLRLHDGTTSPQRWIEIQARIVDDQEKVARTLFELPTPGFVIWNLRSYFRMNQSMVLISGIENLTDRFYFEHLDYRGGLGVFRPGFSPYLGVEVTY